MFKQLSGLKSQCVGEMQKDRTEIRSSDLTHLKYIKVNVDNLQLIAGVTGWSFQCDFVIPIMPVVPLDVAFVPMGQHPIHTTSEVLEETTDED